MLETVENDLKNALKTGDKFTLQVLRLLKSELVLESRKGTAHELTDDDVIKVIKHQVKVRKDNIEEYTGYGKMDLVKDLEKEVEILSKYLPAEMSEEEINKVIDEVFEELKPESIKEMGSVMKVISSKITNADMALVSKIVKDRLTK